MARLRNLDDEVLERPFDKRLFLRMLKYLKPYKKQMVVSFILMLVVSGASLTNPYLFSRAVGALTDGNYGVIPYLFAGTVLSVIVGSFCLRMRIRTMNVAGRKAIAALRQDLFNHIQSLSLPFFDNRSAGKIMVRVINDVNRLNDLFTNGIINVLVDCLTLFLLVGIMFALHWKLTLVALCSLVILGIIIMLLRRRMRRAWQIVRIKTATMHGYLHESLAGMRVTQTFVREKRNKELFDETNLDIKNSWLKAVGINNLFWPSIDILSALGTAGVYVAGLIFMGPAGSVDGLVLADLLAILWYLGRFWEPINNLSTFYNDILAAMASIERIYEIMDTKPLVFDLRDDMPRLPPIEGRIEFDHVHFSYDTKQPVLKDVSFAVRPGQTIALVGPTGAGKSTIVNLVSRFYDVTGGALRIDGHDVREVQLNSLRRQMSVMLQDSFIFSGTILDNIRYGRLDASEEDVIEVCKAVRVHDFIMSLPRGYRTEMGERGASLSTGQKQLVSFARALLNDPRILILDEATSSIDTRTEMLIQEALGVLLKGRTSFVIAHRLSTIRRADRILVVQDGGIAESGTHDELMKIPGGQYRTLVESQYSYMED
ncbi:MAG: ABC transporter ATP-binding protein [Clostridiales bacterium]|nr:ABC transporter ATP-binding protein [Clostridiales bacterium]